MADPPKGKLSFRNPGPKEYLIVGGVVLLGVLAWTFIRARSSSSAAAPTAAGSSGDGVTRSSMTTTVATSPETLRLWIIDHASSPRARGHGHGHAGHHGGGGGGHGRTWARQVASGTRSLDQIASERHTTVKHIEDLTLGNPEISAANKRRFRDYVRGGTGRRMPAGLVFYTSHHGAGAGYQTTGPTGPARGQAA